MKTKNLAIVFTDIKGFTERTSRQTLEQNEKLLAAHDAVLVPIFKAFGGRVVKKIGDAFLVVFESPTAAVLSGVALQDKLWEHNRSASAEERLDVRVAINVGEVRLEDGDVFGEPVNIAARIEGVAEAGEVTFTEAVHLAMNRAEVPAEVLGEFELKGIPGKVKAYRVPRAPYKVEPSGGDGSGPPFGNLGLSKMPQLPPNELSSKAAELTVKAVKAVEEGGKLAAAAVAEASVAVKSLPPERRTALVRVAGALVVLGGVAALVVSWPSKLETAVAAVAAAPAGARDAKVDEAKKLIATLPDASERAYWTGRLDEAEDDPRAAATQYWRGISASHRASKAALLDMLESPKCRTRVAGLEVVGRLKLKDAKGRVKALAENGGPGDGEKVLIFGCNSKTDAQSVLQELE